MKEIIFSSHFFKENLIKFAKKIPDKTITFVCSALTKNRNNDTNYPFRQDSNFFYLTGLELNRAILVIQKESKENTKLVLFRKVTPPEMIVWTGEDMSNEEITSISGISDIRSIPDLDEFYENAFRTREFSDILMYNEPYNGEVIPTYTQAFAQNLKSRFPFINIKAYNRIIHEMRFVKHKSEIKIIRRSIEITKNTMIDVLKNFKNYKNERSIEADLIRGYLHYGGNGHAFAPIVASGENATTLHYEKNDSKISSGDLVLLDTGAEYKNYASDISRTFPSNGKYSPKQKDYYNIVKKAHDTVCQAIKPGVTLTELQNITKEVLFAGMKDMKMVREIKDLSKYYYHGVSHPMGIDVHDVSVESPIKLVTGAVITVEPGLYIKEKGIGIRLENDILVTENGFENLSKEIPIDPEEIESIIR
ncbi:MAG: aminopeptidase P N-terminal domain-containing protein [Candidatus Delongbacteria bacterium]|nr:aminopeptidase P N-terminal domain-containing protein [Candidatus Delongbacteria bacterium]MBN2836641.1 aminopeptidase P N-terminal domain-containing protein [Candidatus Delongbacteria bacterium]